MYIEFASGIVKHDPKRRDLNRIGEEEYTILSRTPRTFIQCCINDDPPYGFTVEYQAGSVDKHYIATDEPIALKRVITAFSKYLRGDPSWRQCFEWIQIIVDGPGKQRPGETAAERLGETVGEVLCDIAEQAISSWWQNRKSKQSHVDTPQRAQSSRREARDPVSPAIEYQEPEQISSVTTDKHALEILGLNESATRVEIRRAYLNLSAMYHPDRVSHLGSELQELANSKQKLINEAFARLYG